MSKALLGQPEAARFPAVCIWKSPRLKDGSNTLKVKGMKGTVVARGAWLLMQFP